MKQKHSLWRNRNFVTFFSANALSNLGNWLDFVAVLILFRYTWKADPLLIALIPVMYAIPSILLGQFAGVFADRKDKLKILVYSDWIRGVLTLALVFTPFPFLALAFIFLRNTAGAISLPAQQGLVRRIVDEEEIMKAVTINGSLFQLVKVVGPLIGGSLTTAFSPSFSIAINSASFLLSGVILLFIRPKKEEADEQGGKHGEDVGFWTSWKEGWSYVLNSRILTASLLFGIVTTLTIQMIDAQFVTLFSEIYPERAELTGWVISAIGIGSLLVVLALNKLDDIKKYGWFFGTASLLIGVMTGGFGFLNASTFLFVVIGLGLLGGIGNGLAFTAVNYLIQKEPPKEAIGRVSGIVDSTLSLLFIIGPLLGGLLIHQFGVTMAFRMIGFCLLGVGFVGIVFQNLIWKRARPHANKTVKRRGIQANSNP
ncbi:MFS transporter [Halobacillus litoralis]|uniref:MFS transporter n=1 Tax=Halobacillus litoralis TaxID=45668 RepID=A0A845E287_9BACI|nr:MFS transporter [Halobacillus litoralis]MYL49857.1 MFS transporter [Halobacillus litoralis]